MPSACIWLVIHERPPMLSDHRWNKSKICLALTNFDKCVEVIFGKKQQLLYLLAQGTSRKEVIYFQCRNKKEKPLWVYTVPLCGPCCSPADPGGCWATCPTDLRWCSDSWHTEPGTRWAPRTELHLNPNWQTSPDARRGRHKFGWMFEERKRKRETKMV